MSRIVIAGAGAIGASIAYHLARAGARDVVLVERGEVAGGSTARAMGGVRQQFSTAAEVLLARESITFFEDLGSELFQQVGYLFVATTPEGLATLESRRVAQLELGVPVERMDADQIAELAPGVRTDDLAGGVFCATDGTADPAAVTRELVRRAVARGVELREHTRAESVEGEVCVIACGAHSAAYGATVGVDLPVRPLCRQLILTTPIPGLPARLPMTVEAESGFHFRRRADRLLVAMADSSPRWGFEESVDGTVIEDRLERLRHRFPPAIEPTVERAWSGLYDMTPDAHPIIGPVGSGVYAACGFSGHGFMQSPAVGRAVASELLGGSSAIDLSPYRLERFAGKPEFAEDLIL